MADVQKSNSIVYITLCNLFWTNLCMYAWLWQQQNYVCYLVLTSYFGRLWWECFSLKKHVSLFHHNMFFNSGISLHIAIKINIHCYCRNHGHLKQQDNYSIYNFVWELVSKLFICSATCLCFSSQPLGGQCHHWHHQLAGRPLGGLITFIGGTWWPGSCHQVLLITH